MNENPTDWQTQQQAQAILWSWFRDLPYMEESGEIGIEGEIVAITNIINLLEDLGKVKGSVGLRHFHHAMNLKDWLGNAIKHLRWYEALRETLRDAVNLD